MSNHVVIAEDDELLIKFLTTHLQQAGYRVSPVLTGGEIFQILDSEAVDLIIIDLGLPDGDGLSRCQQIRERSAVPIVVLTARRGLDDRLMALGLGVDDYIMKPCDSQELLLRVRNILGRTSDTAPAPAAPRPASVAPQPTLQDAERPAKTGRLITAGLLAAIAAAFAGGYWLLGQPATESDVDAAASPPAVTPLPQTSSLTPPVRPSPASVDDAVTAPRVAPRTGDATTSPPLDAQRRAMAARSYSWVMKSTCGTLPSVSWWNIKTHTQMARFVNTKLSGDWNAYIDTWFDRLAQLQRIDGAEGTLKTESGERLAGDALKTYIDQTKRRIDITLCLSQAAADFAESRATNTR